MKFFDAGLAAALEGARDQGIAPVYFFWVKPRDRDTGAETPLGFWTGDEDISISAELPGGGAQTRTYLGGCNLSIEGLRYTVDLNDYPVTVTLSQIADAAQHFARGLDPGLPIARSTRPACAGARSSVRRSCSGSGSSMRADQHAAIRR
ncbi:hypothetical protein ACFSS8_05905 [Paracoccus kondratievae]